MGPYSTERQQRRREVIASLLLNTNLSDDARLIWEQHLRNMALTETEYNRRVVEIYGGDKWTRYTGTLAPILLGP